MTAKLIHMPDRLPDDDLVLIPEGEYELSYQYHATWLYMGRIPKVIVAFRIFDMGEHYDKPVLAYYNPKQLKGKPRRNGHFSAGWRSRLMWDYSMCFGKPPRQDRISMCRFKEHIVVGKVRTVTNNRLQREYPEGLRYSIVGELLGKKEI